MSIVDTWDWDKLKPSEEIEEDIIKCKFCNHEFVPFENFVVCSNDNGKEIFMCENCFFDFALSKLNCREAKMDYGGTDYYIRCDNDNNKC